MWETLLFELSSVHLYLVRTSQVGLAGRAVLQKFTCLRNKATSLLQRLLHGRQSQTDIFFFFLIVNLPALEEKGENLEERKKCKQKLKCWFVFLPKHLSIKTLAKHCTKRERGVPPSKVGEATVHYGMERACGAVPDSHSTAPRPQGPVGATVLLKSSTRQVHAPS